MTIDQITTPTLTPAPVIKHHSYANLVFLLTFLVIVGGSTPLVLKLLNAGNTVALISPLPDPGDILPTTAPVNPVTVAAPALPNEASQSATSSATTKSNSTKNSFVVPAGQAEFEVINPKVSGSSYVYLIPATQTNSVVSVKSKSAGKFTITVSPAENIDLTIDYLLINQ